jgi:CRISPR-associated protein (TIGR02584 family)
MLAFVAGTSPQIITETAYVLRNQGPSRRPVRVLTTTAGAEVIRNRLLGRGGAWARFRKAYREADRFGLSMRSIVVLKGADRKPLSDVRTAADNLAAADQIAAFVRRHTQPGCRPLHASIAGGRKTMGYLLAAAMMLYGRQEDRLSHVLVYPPELEGSSFFFPPARRAGAITVRTAGGGTLRVPLREIRLELADLPFPRLGLLRGVRDLGSRSFSEMVGSIQAQLDILTAPKVEIDAFAAGVCCKGTLVPLSPVQTAIYALLAERRKVHARALRCAGCSECFVPAREIHGAFRDRLAVLMRQRQSHAVATSWGLSNFRPEVGKINDALRRALGAASEPYEITVRGARLRRLYGIPLPPEAITCGSPAREGANIAMRGVALVRG